MAIKFFNQDEIQELTYASIQETVFPYRIYLITTLGDHYANGNLRFTGFGVLSETRTIDETSWVLETFGDSYSEAKEAYDIYTGQEED